jgi:hypothetical protein
MFSSYTKGGYILRAILIWVYFLDLNNVVGLLLVFVLLRLPYVKE